MSGSGENEGSPDPTVWGEESEKSEVGEEERNEFREACEDEDVAGDAEKEKGTASEGGGDWEAGRDLDGDSGEGDREVVIKKDGVGTEEGSGDTDGLSVGEDGVELEADAAPLSHAVLLVPGSCGALVVGAAAVVVVDCPLLWPFSLDLSLDLSLGLLVPTSRRDTWISPFASTPPSSPLPSISPLAFSSPLLLSSPLYFLPLPLPLPLVLRWDVVTSGWTPVCVSTLTPPTDVAAAAELEGVTVGNWEFSELLLLSAILGSGEASEVRPRWVDVSSPGGVEFSLVGALNHDLPQENKPTEKFRKQRKTKTTAGITSNAAKEPS